MDGMKLAAKQARSAAHSAASAAWQEYYDGRTKVVNSHVASLIGKIVPRNRKQRRATFPARFGHRYSYT